MMGVANLDRLRRRRDSWRKARGRLFEQKVEMRDLTGPKRINGIGRASYVCLLALNFTDQQGATDQRFLVSFLLLFFCHTSAFDDDATAGLGWPRAEPAKQFGTAASAKQQARERRGAHQ